MANKIKDTDYLAISARVRAMETTLLTAERMERLLEARSDEEVSKLLQDCGYPELDAAVSARTRQLFPNGAVRCENDCYVGFAGAFGLKAGINVVAGTGAIAYGEDEEGHAARSGG